MFCNVGIEKGHDSARVSANLKNNLQRAILGNVGESFVKKQHARRGNEQKISQ
jgi:hypothetical protein